MTRRLCYLGIALCVIPIGLFARSLRSNAEPSTPFGFISTYLADTLWAVMFFFLFAALMVRAKAWRVGLFTLVFTVVIEVSQLYQGEPLASLRGFPPTRFLLGTNFLWSDIACLCVGTAAAAALHHLIRRRPAHHT